MTDDSDHDILLEIRGDVKNLLKCQEDHEDRIRRLEGNQLKVLGAGALTGFIAGWFSRLIYGGQ